MSRAANSELTQIEMQRVIAGYGQMVRERIDGGFEATLLTFMFSPFERYNGPPSLQMRKAIETIYAKHLTHIYRHPRRQPVMSFPFWIACPDWPVPKHRKVDLWDVATNDGQHSHAVALTPPFKRMRESLAEHLNENCNHYAGVGSPVLRLHALPITETPKKVVGYALKSLGRRRAGLDDVLILPRTHGEM